MAKGKRKAGEKKTQLELFPEELPAPTSLAEEQTLEAAAPQKRGRKKKLPEPSETSSPVSPDADDLPVLPVDVPEEEQTAEAAEPKRRGRKKKLPDLSESVSASPADTSNPPASTIIIPVEEPVPQQPETPAAPEQPDREQKEKFRKLQEERLAALRRARGKK